MGGQIRNTRRGKRAGSRKGTRKGMRAGSRKGTRKGKKTYKKRRNSRRQIRGGGKARIFLDELLKNGTTPPSDEKRSEMIDTLFENKDVEVDNHGNIQKLSFRTFTIKEGIKYYRS